MLCWSELMAKCRSVGLAAKRSRGNGISTTSVVTPSISAENELMYPEGGERFLFRYKSGDDDFVEANPADNFLADSDCVNVRKIPQVCLGIFLDCENPVVVGRRDNTLSLAGMTMAIGGHSLTGETLGTNLPDLERLTSATF